MKMTWTLFGMSFCYFVFVGPIFCCAILEIKGTVNLGCFILYWFQVYKVKKDLYFKLTVLVHHQLCNLCSQMWTVQESIHSVSQDNITLVVWEEDCNSDIKEEKNLFFCLCDFSSSENEKITQYTRDNFSCPTNQE